MMMSSWNLTPYILEAVHFYIIVPKETLISIELRFQRFKGWHGLEENILQPKKCWRQHPGDYTKSLC